MLKIRKQGDSVLSLVAKDVALDDDVSSLLDDMWEAMYLNKGIGLAANQVGVLKRVFVMHANGLKQAFINPVITLTEGLCVAITRCIPTALPIWAILHILSSTSEAATIIRSASSSMNRII